MGVGLVGCSFDAVGSGGTVGGGDGTDATDGTTSASSGVGTLATLGGQSGDGSTGSSTAVTGTASGGGDDTTSSTGEPRPELVTDGVLARYYLDEAGAGQTPAAALDAIEPEVDLPIAYVDSNPRYTEIAGHRGLGWSGEGLDGGPSLPYAGTKFMTALQDHPDGTLEVVAEIQAITSDSSRLLHFGFDEHGGEFTLACNDAAELQFRSGDGTVTADFAVDVLSQGRSVYTLTFDAEATPEQRVHLYIDGMEVPASSIDSASADPLSFGGQGSIALGNRAVGSRSFHGVLYYAAVYERALTPEEVAINAALLLEDDDSP